MRFPCDAGTYSRATIDRTVKCRDVSNRAGIFFNFHQRRARWSPTASCDVPISSVNTLGAVPITRWIARLYQIVPCAFHDSAPRPAHSDRKLPPPPVPAHKCALNTRTMSPLRIPRALASCGLIKTGSAANGILLTHVSGLRTAGNADGNR